MKFFLQLPLHCHSEASACEAASVPSSFSALRGSCLPIHRVRLPRPLDFHHLLQSCILSLKTDKAQKTILELASANIALAHSYTIDLQYHTTTVKMFSRSILVTSALAVLANAQATIVTSSASSVAPSSTVAQSMPPAATAAFNSANVTSSEKCKFNLLSCSRALLTLLA